MTTNSDALIAAIYSMSMAPELYNESIETIDNIVSSTPVPPLPPEQKEGQGQNHEHQKHIFKPEILLHIKKSNELHDRIARQTSAKPITEILLETAPNPALILNEAGEIIAMNELAKSMQKGQTSTLDDYCNNEDVLASIQNFIAATKSEKLLIKPDFINPDKNINTCILIRKIEDHQTQGNPTARRVDNLFFFTLVNLGIAPARTTLFKDTYGLTNAEAKVAVLLSSGLQIPEIAAKRGAKIQTIRSQIKAIKAKTHSRDVPSIIRLLCGFSAGLLTTSPLTNSQTPSTKPRPLPAMRSLCAMVASLLILTKAIQMARPYFYYIPLAMAANYLKRRPSLPSK